jgi:hypothetical protein
MVYVELLRLRSALYIYAGVIAAVVLTIIVSLNWGVSTHRDQSDLHMNGTIGISALMALAVYASAVFATIIGTSLNKASDQAEVVFTKPISRERLAATFILADLGGIVASFVIATLLFALVVLDVGFLVGAPLRLLRFDAATFRVIFLGLGIAFMWYGLLQAATSSYRGRGGLVVGLSWAFFVIFLGVAAAPLPPAIHAVIIAIDHLNPLAYLGSTSITTSGNTVSLGNSISIFHYDSWLRAAIAWGIGTAGCAVAILGWKRLEI